MSSSFHHRAVLRFWKVVNPIARPLAGYAPWWVLLETTGNKSGLPRQTPLVNGPIDGQHAYVISVWGTNAAFARNIAANPRVRLKRRGRWLSGTAQLVDLDPDLLRRFSAYGRFALARTTEGDPKLVRIQLDAGTR